MFSTKKITQYFTTVLILPAILLSTCSENSEYGDASDYEKLGASDFISPTITSVSPTDNTSDVTVSTTITATFSEKISTGTATTNTSDTTCSGSFQLSSDNFSNCTKMSAAPSVSNDDKTFSLTPADNLSEGTTYKLKLTTSVKDTGGNALENAYTTDGFFTYYNRFTFGSGIIRGSIIDNETSALSGVDVEYNIGGYTKTVNSDNDGDYGIYSLTSGSYTLTYSKSGYQGATQSATLASDTDNITVATLTMCPSGSSGGDISGQIKNAVNRDNVSGVLISLRSGLNTRSGSTISGKTDTTADNGTYTIEDVDAGAYTAEASKDDWITSYFNISSCNGAINQNTNMSETLPEGAMRIVTTWKGTEDFDSHLEIPVSDSTNGASNSSDGSHLFWQTYHPGFDYHVYGTGDNVTLDQDNTMGIVSSCPSGETCGPETITISKVLSSGSYRFHVHAFSKKGKDNETTHLADNGTVVQVFYDNGSYNFDVPKSYGDLWTVFDFDNSTREDKFIKTGFKQLNIMSTQSKAKKVDDH